MRVCFVGGVYNGCDCSAGDYCGNDVMKYNPDIHHRHSIRLKDFDYSSEGAYFVTICTENRECTLASVRRGDPRGRPKMELTELGRICNNMFFGIAAMYNIIISKYVIMPNHIHFILVISDETTSRATARVAPTVGEIVGGYKSIVTNLWLKKCKENDISMGEIWQQNYYEHIIRDKQDYMIKWNYIENNPMNWDKDEYNS